MSASAVSTVSVDRLENIDPDRFRMLLLDLDGTALNNEGEIGDADRRAAAALQAEGITVAIATGRLYGGTEPHARSLGVCTQVACMNGAEVVHPEDGEVVFANYLPNEVAVAVRDRLREHELATSLFNSMEIHHGPEATPYQHYLKTWSTHFRAWEDVYQSPAWEEDPRLMAVVSTGPIAQIRHAAEVIGASVDPELYEILAFPAWPRKPGDPEHGLFMFRDRREDKGTALRRLADDAGIEEQQVVCVGDWVNDVPMLRTDALSFAMGGTPDWLVEAADHVAHTRKDQGGVVAELAERVWGIRA